MCRKLSFGRRDRVPGFASCSCTRARISFIGKLEIHENGTGHDTLAIHAERLANNASWVSYYHFIPKRRPLEAYSIVKQLQPLK